MGVFAFAECGGGRDIVGGEIGDEGGVQTERVSDAKDVLTQARPKVQHNVRVFLGVAAEVIKGRRQEFWLLWETAPRQHSH